MQTSISIKQLKKRYANSETNALDHINLDIHQGDFLGLLGPNGSGKTTLISILCGLISATSGDFTINGKPFSKTSKKIIGLVPQEIALYPTLTFRENLSFFANLYGLSNEQIKQRSQYAIKIAQLEKYADQRIENYSGGMKRRANLATSLVHDPEIIFLDEPCVNVDPQSRYVIYENLLELNKAGKTLIYTTHYIEEAERLCTNVAIIENGKILVKNTPNELIQQNPGSKNLGDVFLQLTGGELRDE